MTKPSVCVHGPAACGKTRNAEAIRAALGLKHITDDWYFTTHVRAIPAQDHLILSELPMPEESGVKNLSFDSAIQLLKA